MEGYYREMMQLQEKLRKSEQERYLLEEKFNYMLRMTRDAEHERLRILRHKYNRFIEEDRRRQERNNEILRILEKIETRAANITAKTHRFNQLRKQFALHLRSQNERHKMQSPTQHTVRRKLYFEVPDNYDNKIAKSKINLLEKYIRENNETEHFLDSINTNKNDPIDVSPESKSYDNFLDKVIGSNYATVDQRLNINPQENKPYLQENIPQSSKNRNLSLQEGPLNISPQNSRPGLSLQDMNKPNLKVESLIQQGFERFRNYQLERSRYQPNTRPNYEQFSPNFDAYRPNTSFQNYPDTANESLDDASGIGDKNSVRFKSYETLSSEDTDQLIYAKPDTFKQLRFSPQGVPQKNTNLLQKQTLNDQKFIQELSPKVLEMQEQREFFKQERNETTDEDEFLRNMRKDYERHLEYTRQVTQEVDEKEANKNIDTNKPRIETSQIPQVSRQNSEQGSEIYQSKQDPDKPLNLNKADSKNDLLLLKGEQNQRVYNNNIPKNGQLSGTSQQDINVMETANNKIMDDPNFQHLESPGDKPSTQQQDNQNVDMSYQQPELYQPKIIQNIQSPQNANNQQNQPPQTDQQVAVDSQSLENENISYQSSENQSPQKSQNSVTQNEQPQSLQEVDTSGGSQPRLSTDTEAPQSPQQVNNQQKQSPQQYLEQTSLEPQSPQNLEPLQSPEEQISLNSQNSQDNNISYQKEPQNYHEQIQQEQIEKNEYKDEQNIPEKTSPNEDPYDPNHTEEQNYDPNLAQESPDQQNYTQNIDNPNHQNPSYNQNDPSQNDMTSQDASYIENPNNPNYIENQESHELNYSQNLNDPNFKQDPNDPNYSQNLDDPNYNQDQNYDQQFDPNYNQLSNDPNYSQQQDPNYNQVSNDPNYVQNLNDPNYNQDQNYDQQPQDPNYTQDSNDPNYDQNLNDPNDNQVQNYEQQLQDPNYNQDSNDPNYDQNLNDPNYSQDQGPYDPNYSQDLNQPNYAQDPSDPNYNQNMNDPNYTQDPNYSQSENDPNYEQKSNDQNYIQDPNYNQDSNQPGYTQDPNYTQQLNDPNTYDPNYPQEYSQDPNYTQDQQYLQDPNDPNYDPNYTYDPNAQYTGSYDPNQEYQPEYQEQSYQQNVSEQQKTESPVKSSPKKSTTDTSSLQSVGNIDNILDTNVGNTAQPEKKTNLGKMLESDTETSIKQDTKISNDSDFDFSQN